MSYWGEKAVTGATDWLVDKYNAGKEWAAEKKEQIVQSKDYKTLTNGYDQFVDQSTGGVARLYNSLTGEIVEGEAAELILVKMGIEPPVPINNQAINPGSVEPEVASQDPVYKYSGKSEAYEIETPGKANSGMGADSNATTVPGKDDVPFSPFNKWSMMNYVGGPLQSYSNYDHYNKPINAGEDKSEFRNPSATQIITQLGGNRNENGATENPGYTYSFSDFALAKYYGKIPNTHMITLRRFPMPVEDDIINPKVLGPDGKTVINNAMPDLARAVTWMSDETGNKLEDILKFDTSTTWEEIESALQERNSGTSQGGKVGEMINGNKCASAIYGASQGLNAQQVRNQQGGSGYDPVKGTYPNHVFGPINIIKKVAIRKGGLDFTGDMTLKFHYSLRQLEGVSPKVAFLDMFANILVLTYNNGNFWGGASRYTGGGGKMNKPFGDFEKLKSGDFAGFVGSIVGDFASAAGNVIDDIKKQGLGGSKAAGNLIGGGLMELFGTPQGGEALNAFMTGDPTGQYHVTIGNPLDPIAVIGNLYCDKTTYKFGGPLSYEGFPTELEVEISLKPARPRDKADIERMFNGGKERMYLTPAGGVDTNENTNTSAYGNADSPQQTDIYRKMTNG